MQAISLGYIDFDFSNYKNTDNFYVKQPEKVIELLTGKQWTVEKQSANYSLKKGEYAIEHWGKNGVGGHFARINNGFNSLQVSENVKNGKIVSYRIFRLKER